MAEIEKVMSSHLHVKENTTRNVPTADIHLKKKYSGTLVIIYIFIFDYIKIKLSEFYGEVDKSVSTSPHMIKHFITHTFVSSL